ncbi:MAG: Gfo/Idh/MocA family oxidoreductase [Cyanothece sp. SIO1E1]|nr:Gfo/Idh/MocA family oxidoreductase [Cyanothece sp. SIO1E1]
MGIAVFGVGRWGVNLLRNFLAHPQVRVVAIVDPRRQRLADLSSQFELDDQVVLSTDWQAALQLPGVGAVAIATPATTHYDLIRAALQHGHHVLAEKPLTLDAVESLELCQLAKQQQRQLVVDHTYLFHPAVQRGKTVMQQGALGNLRYGYATRTHIGPVRHDVDVLWDLAIHDIAIFNYWLGEFPVQVEAQGTVWLQSNGSDAHYFPAGLSDLVWVKLTYPSGFQAIIHLCWLNPDKQRRLCMVGSQGTLIFDELAAAPLTLQHGHLEPIEGKFIPTDLSREVLDLATAEPLWQVCDHFLNCIHHNADSQISSGWLGAELVKILNALTSSLNQGGKSITIS